MSVGREDRTGCGLSTAVAISVLGCKVNQYDAQLLRQLFARAGFRAVDSSERADVYVVASCAVTREAAAKTRQAVRRARRENPDGVVLLLGCYPQAILGRSGPGDEREERMLRDLPADGVFGVGAGEEVVRAARRALVDRSLRVRAVSNVWDCPPGASSVPLEQFAGHARASVKVQDGCDEFCAYCLIPHARGPLRARPLNDVAREVRGLLSRGHREIVLTGIHLGAYDRSPGADVSLAELIRRLSRMPGRWRLRLSSLEPMDVDPEIFAAMAESPRVAHHLHLPLQSGSDEVLEKMGRRYDVRTYAELLRAARRWMPGVGISTDVMVAYPTESEENHRESLQFVRRAGFSRVHVFPYSPRPGTRAATLPGRVPGEVRRRRRDEMLRAADELAERFHAGLRGGFCQILAERRVRREDVPFSFGRDDITVLYGYSANYAPIWVEDPAGGDRVGELLPVRIVDTGVRGCLGRRIGRSAGPVENA